MGVRGIELRRLLFPTVLLAFTVALSALSISGTSAGITDPRDRGLILGHPRPIRSDEWGIATPLIVAQSHHGFPRFAVDGLGRHDLAVTVGTIDVPTRDWSVLFKPWDVPMLFLGLSQGFAARWWLMSDVLIVGAYLLILVWLDRVVIAVVFSLGLWLSPFFQWWYESIALDVPGMALLASAAIIRAWRTNRLLPRLAWLSLATYGVVGFVLLLYPPFQVPVGLVLASVVLGVAWTDIAGRRTRAARVLVDGGVLVGASLVVLGVYFLHTKPALQAISSTSYPGQRRLGGGETPFSSLLSAPYEPWIGSRGFGNLGTTNQSEIASFMLFGPLALLTRFLDGGWHRTESRERVMLLSIMAPLVLLCCWALVGLPGPIAHLLLLDRVEGNRSIIGIGLASTLVLAQVSRLYWSERGGRRRTLASLGSGMIGAVVYFWAGNSLTYRYPLVSPGPILVCAAAALFGLVLVLLLLRPTTIGVPLYLATGVSLVFAVNPLTSSLGLLTASPLIPAVRQISGQDPKGIWLYYGTNLSVIGPLIASGLPTLSIVSPYPARGAWTSLDPGGARSDVWNRYASVYFWPAGPGSSPMLTLLQDDYVQVKVDPCGKAVNALAVRFILSDLPLTGACLTPRPLPAATRAFAYLRS